MRMTKNEMGTRLWSRMIWKTKLMQTFRKADKPQFLNLKKFLADESLRSNQETEDVQDWLKGSAATFFDEGIQKLVPRYEKCL
jgi:hypothetical protein